MQDTEGHSFVERAIGAARLDSRIYKEVAHDRGATMQAAALVVLSSIITAGASALGSGEVAYFFLIGIAFGLPGWAVYAWLAYLIGTRLLAGPETSADWGELARALGFAQAPRLLLALGFVPVLGQVVSFVVWIWVLVTTVVALRAVLDFGTRRAIGTAVLAWLPYVIWFATVLVAVVT